MNWMQNLYETYNNCAGNPLIPDADELCPVGYSIQNAHIEIVLNESGKFRRANLVQKENHPKTFIPVTENSAGRTSGEAPHPLCDSLQYCAADYEEYGGTRLSYFDSYIKQLEKWAQSSFTHKKVKSVYLYAKEGRVIEDLSTTDIIAIEKGKLVVEIRNSPSSKTYPIMKLLTFDDKGFKDQAKIFVRWSVEVPGETNPHTWDDVSLFESWRKYLDSLEAKEGFCHVTGHQTVLAEKHPARLRNGKDGAKLISSNDTSGYTFLGRFLDAEQTAGVSSDVTQKAHSALRWLIGRKQAFRNGDQVFVSWATSGVYIPDPCANTWEFLGQQEEMTNKNAAIGDVGQAFSLRLSKKISGYKANIHDSENIVVMGLDSATPGRMSITFYRELTGSEFLCRIETWHSSFSWFQNFGKDTHFVGMAAPRDIALTAYGRRAEGKNGTKLLNATVERLLPCIIDGARFPTDLVSSCIRRTSNRIGLEPWEWEKCLGIACSIFKGTNKERGYRMALEEDRKTRDYLYGRLLAVGEQIESMALYYAKEKRDTTTARLMQRFADRPFSTWKTIEDALVPYKTRINSRAPGLLAGYKELLDNIHFLFVTEEYNSDKPLSGEYLLGYHCQRKWLREHRREKGLWIEKIETDSNDSDSVEE